MSNPTGHVQALVDAAGPVTAMTPSSSDERYTVGRVIRALAALTPDMVARADAALSADPLSLAEQLLTARQRITALEAELAEAQAHGQVEEQDIPLLARMNQQVSDLTAQRDALVKALAQARVVEHRTRCSSGLVDTFSEEQCTQVCWAMTAALTAAQAGDTPEPCRSTLCRHGHWPDGSMCEICSGSGIQPQDTP